MDRHRYLRAYMGGIALPTMLLLVVMSAFAVARFHYHVPILIERAIVFPMAVIPNLWGVWNMLYIFLKGHFRLPIGLHGMALVILIALIGSGVAKLLGAGFPPPPVLLGPLAALVGYYLAWKYVVDFLNRILEIG